MSLFLGDVQKRYSGPTFPERPIPPFYGSDIYGQTSAATPDTALTVPTVWACVTLLANAVSTLPLETFRLTPNGVPLRVSNPALLTNPSGDMTQSEWLHMLMVSLLLRGNAYGRITARDSYQRPTQIALLSPDMVRVTIDSETGRPVYKLNNSAARDITADIWHVRGMTMPGSVVGLSPIAYAAAAIGVDLASRQFAQDFFSGGGIPKAVVQSNQEINQGQSRTIKDRLLAATRNREPIVLGDGLTYTAISVKPEESQFLATQQANKSQIADYFNIPAEMVNGSSGNSMTYSSIEMRQQDFLTRGVGFWLKRVEDAIFGLLPTPQYAKFNVDALLRTDAETQAKVDNQRLAGKIMAPSEIRQRLGLPPMTPEQKAEADLVPMGVTPLGGAKALPALTEVPGPVAPVPASDDQAQQNSAPTVINNYVLPAEVRQDIVVQPADVRLEQPITVQPAAPAQVRQDVHVAAPEVRQDIHVAAPEVRMVSVGSSPTALPVAARSRRVERDSAGDIVRIVEE